MRKNTSKRQHSSPQDTSPANLTYYIVVLVAGLTGFMSYSSGASLESALTRVLVVLLACTIVGYIVNMVLWVSSSDRQAQESTVKATVESAPRQVGTRVDLVAGDDEADPRPVRNRPRAPARSSQAAG